MHQELLIFTYEFSFSFGVRIAGITDTTYVYVCLWDHGTNGNSRILHASHPPQTLSIKIPQKKKSPKTWLKILDVQQLLMCETRTSCGELLHVPYPCHFAGLKDEVTVDYWLMCSAFWVLLGSGHLLSPGKSLPCQIAPQNDKRRLGPAFRTASRRQPPSFLSTFSLQGLPFLESIPNRYRSLLEK